MNSARIRALRRQFAESQERFAVRVGVTSTTVRNWETGRVEPSPLGLSALLRLEGSVTRDTRDGA